MQFFNVLLKQTEFFGIIPLLQSFIISVSNFNLNLYIPERHIGVQ